MFYEVSPPGLSTGSFNQSVDITRHSAPRKLLRYFIKKKKANTAHREAHNFGCKLATCKCQDARKTNRPGLDFFVRCDNTASCIRAVDDVLAVANCCCVCLLTLPCSDRRVLALLLCAEQICADYCCGGVVPAIDD